MRTFEGKANRIGKRGEVVDGLAIARKAVGLTQQELADEMLTTQSSISNAELNSPIAYNLAARLRMWMSSPEVCAAIDRAESPQKLVRDLREVVDELRAILSAFRKYAEESPRHHNHNRDQRSYIASA